MAPKKPKRKASSKGKGRQGLRRKVKQKSKPRLPKGSRGVPPVFDEEIPNVRGERKRVRLDPGLDYKSVHINQKSEPAYARCVLKALSPEPGSELGDSGVISFVLRSQDK